MRTPKRLQLRRTRGWRLPEHAVIVARPSRFGNPFRAGSYVVNAPPLDAAEAVHRHRAWLVDAPEGRANARLAVEELRGKDLACWCAVDPECPCHANTLLALANCPQAEPVRVLRQGEDYCWGGLLARCVGVGGLGGEAFPEMRYADGSGGALWLGPWMGKIYPAALLDVLEGKEGALRGWANPDALA